MIDDGCKSKPKLANFLHLPKQLAKKKVCCKIFDKYGFCLADWEKYRNFGKIILRMDISFTLEHVLSAHTVEELNVIAKFLDINLSSKLRKIARVRAIANCVIKFPKEVVKRLPSYNLQLLLDVIDGKITLKRYGFYQEYLWYNTLGLIYAVKGFGNDPVFQPELVGVYRPIIEAELKNRRAAGMYKFEQFIIGLTNVYGGITGEEVALFFANSEDDENENRHFEEIFKMLALNVFVSSDGIYYHSPFSIDKGYVHEEFDQKLFDDNFILGMGEMPFMKFNLPSAKRLESYMESKGIPHDEIQLAMTEMWWHQLSQSSNKEFLNIIGRYSPDMRTAAELYTAAVDFVNDIPMWQYKGHSSNEVKEIEERKQRERDLRCGRNIIGYNLPKITFSKKPGRNDPCPCGSGKKYKHCCGRR